jgi:hypothetical protein
MDLSRDRLILELESDRAMAWMAEESGFISWQKKEIFLFFSVQTGPEAQLASYPKTIPPLPPYVFTVWCLTNTGTFMVKH